MLTQIAPGKMGTHLQRRLGLSPAGGLAGEHGRGVVARESFGQSSQRRGGGGRRPTARSRCVARRGSRRIRLRGDTAFSQTRASGSLGRRGRCAVPVRLRREAESHRIGRESAESAWQTLTRPAQYAVKTQPRAKPDNVKRASHPPARVRAPGTAERASRRVRVSAHRLPTTVSDGGHPQEHLA